MTLWTVACEAPQSLKFFRQEYWSGLPFPSPWDLRDSGIEPASLASTCTGRHVCHQLSHQGCSKYFFFIDLAVLSLSCGVLDLLAAACRILSCGVWDLVLLSGIKPGPPALGAWSLNHRTTRPPQESLQEQVFRGKYRRV